VKTDRERESKSNAFEIDQIMQAYFSSQADALLHVKTSVRRAKKKQKEK
jgi:hypothetical protein